MIDRTIEMVKLFSIVLGYLQRLACEFRTCYFWVRGKAWLKGHEIVAGERVT